MPARSWADQPRLKFLKANVSGYEFAQAQKKMRQFLARLHDNYFLRFPQLNENLMSEEKRVHELEYICILNYLPAPSE